VVIKWEEWDNCGKRSLSTQQNRSKIILFFGKMQNSGNKLLVFQKKEVNLQSKFPFVRDEALLLVLYMR